MTEKKLLLKSYYDFRSIEDSLKDLLRYIDLDEKNYFVNSSEIRKIIFSSCSYIENMAEMTMENLEKQKKCDKESVPSFIYRTLKSEGFDLSNVCPWVLNIQLDSW